MIDYHQDSDADPPGGASNEMTLESRPWSPYHNSGPRGRSSRSEESQRSDMTGIAMITKRQQVWFLAAWLLGASDGRVLSAEVPRALDDRLTVEPFAEAPQIVHPVGMTFDARGRLLVVESHT